MTQLRIAADSSCDLLALEGLDFVAVPLTIRTDTEEFRDDAALDVSKMVSTLRNTKGRSYSACPNIADWEDAFGEEGDVIAFTITSSLSGSYSAACAAKKACINLVYMIPKVPSDFSRKSAEKVSQKCNRAN